MRDNLVDNENKNMKKKDNKTKKENRDNPGDNEKEQFRKCKKKERKLCVIILMTKKRSI